MIAICSGNDLGGRLIVEFRPSADVDFRRNDVRHRFLLQSLHIRQRKSHEQARVAAESLIEKWLRGGTGFMRQQLRLNAVDAGRLLQRLDDVRQQAAFNVFAVSILCAIFAVTHEQVADHAFVVFVHEKRIPEDLATRNGGVSGKKFGVHVAENHLRRAAVVPAQQIRPHPYFVLQQRPEVGGREMSEIENLQLGSRKARDRQRTKLSLVAARGRRQTLGTTNANKAAFSLFVSLLLAFGSWLCAIALATLLHKNIPASALQNFPVALLFYWPPFYPRPVRVPRLPLPNVRHRESGPAHNAASAGCDRTAIQTRSREKPKKPQPGDDGDQPSAALRRAGAPRAFGRVPELPSAR